MYGIVAMGGVFAAAAQAPLTAIASVAEMTGNFTLTLPIMLACGLAAQLAKRINHGSIYTTKLLRRGIDIERPKALGALQALTVEEMSRWKPAPETYRHAAERCLVSADQMMLAAVHPWDLAGARRAGLRTAWINRSGAPYPQHLPSPEVSYATFAGLADAVCEG